MPLPLHHQLAVRNGTCTAVDATLAGSETCLGVDSKVYPTSSEPGGPPVHAPAAAEDALSVLETCLVIQHDALFSPG